MSVQDKLGFPPFLEGMVDNRFVVLMLICWAITPGAMILIAPLLESRWLPLSPRRQFLAFFPGDLFLGSGVAAALMAARELSDGRSWWTAPIVHICVIAGLIVFATYMTFTVELKGGVYPKRAILSPTKLYHNYVLYVAYGYVIAVTLIADIAGLGWQEIFRGGWLSLALSCIGIWLLLVVFEGMIFKAAGMAMKAKFAHIADWMPIWKV